MNNIEYQEYIMENLNKTIKYADYISEHLNTISYDEYIAENLDNSEVLRKRIQSNRDEKIDSLLNGVQ